MIQYARSSLKITEIRKQHKRRWNLLIRPPGNSLLLGCERKEAVQCITLAGEHRQHLWEWRTDVSLTEGPGDRHWALSFPSPLLRHSSVGKNWLPLGIGVSKKLYRGQGGRVWLASILWRHLIWESRRGREDELSVQKEQVLVSQTRHYLWEEGEYNCSTHQGKNGDRKESQSAKGKLQASLV